MGRRHLAALSGLSTASVVGVADRNADPSASPGTPVLGSLDDLLALRPEAVVVATPAGTHPEVVGRCLARGVHVLVEKPIATSVTDAHAMVAAAERTGLVLSVGHAERFAPVMPRLRAAITAAPPTAISTTRLGMSPARVRDVGVLLDLAVHDIDLVRWLTGREYAQVGVEVMARGEDGRETHARMRGLLDDGTRVTHDVSWIVESAARHWTLTYAHGDDTTFDLMPSRMRTLMDQDAAFLAACHGRPSAAPLATGAEGTAAVQVALAAEVDVLPRARGESLPSQGGVAAVAAAAPGGRSAAPA